MLWQGIASLRIEEHERLTLCAGGDVIALARHKRRGSGVVLYDLHRQRSHWIGSEASGPSQLLGVSPTGQVFALPVEASIDRTFGWSWGDSIWEPLGAGPPGLVVASCALRAGGIAVVVQSRDTGGEDRWAVFEADDWCWRAGPSLGTAAQDWAVHELDDGRLVALSLVGGRVVTFDRARARVHGQTLRLDGDGPSVVAGKSGAVYWCAGRELYRLSIGGSMDEPRARRLPCEPEHVFVVGDFLVLVASSGLSLAPLTILDRHFANLSLPEPHWQSLDLPRQLERQRDNVRFDFDESPMAMAIRTLAAGPHVLMARPSAREAYLATLGPDGPWRHEQPPATDEAGAWQVLGDWLSDRGDPRGPALSHVGLKTDGPDSLASIPHACADRVLEAWAEQTEEIELVYAHGFITRARLRSPRRRAPNPRPSFLALLGEAPSAAFLTRVDLDAVPQSEREPPRDLDHYISELALSFHLPRIRELHIGPTEVPDLFIPEIRARIETMLETEFRPEGLVVGELAAIERLADTLEVLSVTGTMIELEVLSLPRLERLHLRTPELSGESLAQLVRCELPRLEILELWMGASGPQLETVLDAAWPRLRELCLRNMGDPGTWLRALLNHPRGRDLDKLDLASHLLSRRAQKRLRRVFGERVCFT